MELDNLALKQSFQETSSIHEQNGAAIPSLVDTSSSERANFFECDENNGRNKLAETTQADNSELTENDVYSGCGTPVKKKTNKKEKAPTSPTQSEGDNGSEEGNSIRRSTRNPDMFYLSKPDVKRLLDKIKTNDEDTVVLKIKQHGITDINCAVINEILKALWSNKVCQVSYFCLELLESINTFSVPSLGALYAKYFQSYEK
jgi:hypothetical protein